MAIPYVILDYTIRGPVAQLGARFHGMEEVVSSNLTRSTMLSSWTSRKKHHQKNKSASSGTPGHPVA